MKPTANLEEINREIVYLIKQLTNIDQSIEEELYNSIQHLQNLYTDVENSQWWNQIDPLKGKNMTVYNNISYFSSSVFTTISNTIGD